MSIMNLPSKLGAISEYGRIARDAYYAEHKVDMPADNGRARCIERVQWLMDEAKAKRFKTFLDLGCHDGFTSRFLVDEIGFQTLVGVDISKDAINWCFEHLKSQRNPGKAFYVACGYDKLITPCKFDGVSCFEMIEHFTLEEAAEIVKFMHSHLSSAGRGYLCTPNISGKWGSCNPDPHHIVLYSKETLTDLVSKTIGKSLQFWKYSQDCEHLHCYWDN